MGQLLGTKTTLNFRTKSLLGSPSGTDDDIGYALSDDDACGSAVRSWKHIGAHRLNTESLYFGSRWTLPCDVCPLLQRDAVADLHQLLCKQLFFGFTLVKKTHPIAIKKKQNCAHLKIGTSLVYETLSFFASEILLLLMVPHMHDLNRLCQNDKYIYERQRVKTKYCSFGKRK